MKEATRKGRFFFTLFSLSFHSTHIPHHYNSMTLVGN